jgi:hypothetical protein
LLGQATEAQLDHAVEILAVRCSAAAICAVGATGFDLDRMRPARALARWANAKIPVASPSSGGSASTFIAWHINRLSELGMPAVGPRLLGSGRVDWADVRPRIEFGPLRDVPGLIAIFQTMDGVVLGAFTPCRNPGGAEVPDPTLKTTVFVLEHPSGEQRFWTIRDPANGFGLDPLCVSFGDAFAVTWSGYLLCAARPSMSFTAYDAQFMCAGGREQDGVWRAGITRWEFWGVEP